MLLLLEGGIMIRREGRGKGDMVGWRGNRRRRRRVGPNCSLCRIGLREGDLLRRAGGMMWRIKMEFLLLVRGGMGMGEDWEEEMEVVERFIHLLLLVPSSLRPSALQRCLPLLVLPLHRPRPP